MTEIQQRRQSIYQAYLSDPNRPLKDLAVDFKVSLQTVAKDISSSFTSEKLRKSTNYIYEPKKC